MHDDTLIRPKLPFQGSIIALHWSHCSHIGWWLALNLILRLHAVTVREHWQPLQKQTRPVNIMKQQKVLLTPESRTTSSDGAMIFQFWRLSMHDTSHPKQHRNQTRKSSRFRETNSETALHVMRSNAIGLRKSNHGQMFAYDALQRSFQRHCHTVFRLVKGSLYVLLYSAEIHHGAIHGASLPDHQWLLVYPAYMCAHAYLRRP